MARDATGITYPPDARHLWYWWSRLALLGWSRTWLYSGEIFGIKVGDHLSSQAAQRHKTADTHQAMLVSRAVESPHKSWAGFRWGSCVVFSIECQHGLWLPHRKVEPEACCVLQCGRVFKDQLLNSAQGLKALLGCQDYHSVQASLVAQAVVQTNH